MSRIDIGEIQAFAYQLHTANETGRKSIKDIKNAVKNYTEDGSLKGKAIEASKNYYQMTYFPLCDAIIEAMNESEERLAQYIADFHAQVDGSADARIDADGLYELGKMIDRIEAKKEALAQRMNTGTEGQMQSYRSQLSIAYKQENILEKYLAFEQSHGGFFDNLTDLVQGIQQTIRELQSNIQFNSKTGTYDMSKLNFTTVTRMQNVLEKALNDNAKTFNFDEYQKTYRGQMWVLMKNGIVDVEATNAYNAAVLGGKMPHESNEAQEEAELLQAVIQSVKEGTDPVTGQEISKSQGFGIISGLIFRYTVGGYKGKKFKLPKAWLNRRKKASGVKKIEKTPELEDHIRNTDPNVPRKRGIGGAHNSEEFFKNDVEIVKQTPTDIPGVSVVEYRIPELDVKGNPTGRYKKTIYKKTIYNPKVISDEEYINRGLEAANNATSNPDDGSLPREWTGKDNTGKTWRGYYEDGKITSFYPD
ncbi:T7SS effector LXG polymorphic toxin [Listeria swaminathanii]|uniref:T7SS effector LXG polymorphic toxin n=3 Tax=Listeria swaminathanii TaxID=2713501 RepID=A0ABU2IHE5_9LIST|nr:T7SS effector LXG polymorphic toxin [Listeria swaminathanii]MDT0017405.1 T7SS effector LXG polymorphic toxin [Listeria swaminathanii]MDT0023359.1 T7SS effector LXG polymorphic toxin [Listeria swaminathanii]MDT0034301.1 T7SS effector LXG polymorphic toxin [Listeria swaminathanii]MDT0053124.1 T7SS effector LXG polymorphic toxin [Listeria swaminathanii]MDT0055889.1 T7SS effector LXG polymorphic toxin [Listeria swaminathanii]